MESKFALSVLQTLVQERREYQCNRHNKGHTQVLLK